MAGLLSWLLPAAPKVADAAGEAVGRLVDLIPEGERAKRADQIEQATEQIKRLVVEGKGPAAAVILRAATRPALTAALVGAWLAGVHVEPVDILGQQIGLGHAALAALAWWFSERGILGMLGRKA